MHINRHNAYTDLAVVLFFLERCEEIFISDRTQTDKTNIPFQSKFVHQGFYWNYLKMYESGVRSDLKAFSDLQAALFSEKPLLRMGDSVMKASSKGYTFN